MERRAGRARCALFRRKHTILRPLQTTEDAKANAARSAREPGSEPGVLKGGVRKPDLVVEGVGGDALGEAGSDGGRGRAPGLAGGLVLEGRQKLGDEVKPRKAVEDLGSEGRGPGVGVAAADIESGALAQQVALAVECGIDLRPHVPDDDLLDAGAALRRPTGAGREDPADVPAGVLERRPVVVK